MKMHMFFISLLGSGPCLSENFQLLSGFGEIVSPYEVRQAIQLIEKKDDIILDIVPDYKFNKIYAVIGALEKQSSAQVVDIFQRKSILMLPGAFSINVPVVDNAPYFVASQVGAEYYLPTPKIEIRSRTNPSKVIASKIQNSNTQARLSIDELISGCYDVENKRFFKDGMNYSSVDIKLDVHYKQQVGSERIGGCWPDGTKWYLDFQNGAIVLRLSTWGAAKSSVWSYDRQFSNMLTMGTTKKYLIPDLETPQLTRSPTIKIFDFTSENAKIVSAKSELNKGENVLFFAGLSRNRQSAHYIAGHYASHERKRYSDQLFRLTNYNGNWLLEQVDISLIAAFYEKTTKRKLNIQWVIDN